MPAGPGHEATQPHRGSHLPEAVRRVAAGGCTIYVCVRQTLDWGDAAAVEAGLIADFRPKVEVWNATFDMPYHTFRQRLKQIAQTSLDRVGDATSTPLEQVPRGAIVVPVDDDDWLSPDLASYLREAYRPELEGYHWTRHLIELPAPRNRRWWLRPWLRRPVRCATNNYAIANRPELTRLVYNHMKATEYFRRSRSRIKRISKTLSIQNRTMASQTAMAWRRPSITREELVASFQRYRGLYADLDLPHKLRWARPYVESMAELMARIGIK